MTVLEHATSGMAAGSAFTIGIAEAAKSVGTDAAFRTSDVADERIAVYRSDTGARIFAVTVPSPEPTVQTFGLSPDGGQLAVLAGGQIAFFSLPRGWRRGPPQRLKAESIRSDDRSAKALRHPKSNIDGEFQCSVGGAKSRGGWGWRQDR